jgi:hypothetical protein
MVSRACDCHAGAFSRERAGARNRGRVGAISYPERLCAEVLDDLRLAVAPDET